MASKKNLKKKINRFIIEDVIDECIYIEEKKPEMEGDCDKIIDEAVEFYNEMMEKINAAKSKQEFKTIGLEFENKVDYFVEALNKVNEKK